MVPVALVTKFAPVLGGLAREVLARFIRGVLRLPVSSDFVRILTLFIASVAL